jgi:hypothetical protein
MAAATLMSLFFTPVFFVVMQSLSERGSRKRADAPSAPATEIPQ